jgi:hypothetical protein
MHNGMFTHGILAVTESKMSILAAREMPVFACRWPFLRLAQRFQSS